jgi:hypothetical protein
MLMQRNAEIVLGLSALHPPSAFDTPNHIIVDFKVFSGLLRQRLSTGSSNGSGGKCSQKHRSLSSLACRREHSSAMGCRNKFGMTLRVADCHNQKVIPNLFRDLPGYRKYFTLRFG